jgi:RNA polymerase sigma-70 factor (ECF subfamily)
LTQDRAEADDLMQDTLERALVSREQFLAGSNLRAWVFSIMRNLFIDACRHATSIRLQQQAHQLSGTGAMSTAPDTGAFDENVAFPDWADEAPLGETHQGPLDLLSTEDVDAAIATLAPAQREIFELAYRQRVSHRVIAARLRVPIGTIGTRLFRGRARLRSFLEGLYRQRHGMSSDSIRWKSEPGTRQNA